MELTLENIKKHRLKITKVKIIKIIIFIDFILSVKFR